MFRSLRTSLTTLHSRLTQSSKDSALVRDVVAAYLAAIPGLNEIAAEITVSYDRTQQSVLVESDSKTVASEILLHAARINDALRERGLYIRSFIAR